MGHRHRGDGDARLVARGDNLRLEFIAVLPPPPANDSHLFRKSIHESTEKLSGLEAPMPSAGNQDGMAGRLQTTPNPMEYIGFEPPSSMPAE